MRIALILINLCIIGLCQAQIGINTLNPQGVFHLDPLQNNNITGKPTVAQSADDVIIDKNGNLGLGTTSLDAKLHIVTEGTSTKPVSGFQLADGTEKERCILYTDDSGRARWKPARAPVMYAELSNGVNIPCNTGAWYLTGSKLILPPGTWVVTVCMFVAFNPSIANKDKIWLISSWSDSNTATTTSSDIVGGKNIAGLLSKDVNYNFLSGSLILQNKGTQSKTYYYMALVQNQGDNVTVIDRFGGNYGLENIIFAYQLNT